MEVELGYEPQVPPEILYHGTVGKFLPSIRAQGLFKGERRGQPILLKVQSGAMHRAAHIFYRSANGVWLVENVPADFLIVPSTDEI